MAKRSDTSAASRFDAAYYERYYEDPRTQVTTASDLRPLVAFVVAYIDYLGLKLRRVIDFGPGVGLWRDVLGAVLTDRAWSYVGVDVSPTACRRHGWLEGSVVSYRPKGRFDLVVCSGVLQYVPDRDLGKAIANLGACCRGVLYLHVPTELDREQVLDTRVSDQDVYFRPGALYRRHVTRHFISLGGGLFAPRDTTLPLWELEYDDAR